MSTNTNKKNFFNYRSPKAIVYTAVVILFFVYLISASDIYAAFISNSVKKKSVDFDALNKDSVLFFMDSIQFYDDFNENIHLYGWAFCETLVDNADKEIWAIFKSDKTTYVFKNELQISEINNVFSTTHNIRGKYHRFRGTVSTAIMKNGLYKLYIYCKENNENYGIVDTGIMLKKGSRSISQYKWTSSPCDISETKISEDIKYNIDSVSVTNEGYFQINGWTFAEGLDTAGQAVYVRLTHEDGSTATYDTQSISRPDVGAAYKNDLYNNSGFKMLIPVDELKDGDVTVEILISDGENVYLTTETYLYSKDVPTFEKSIDTANVKNVSNEVEIDTWSTTKDSSVKYYIDSCLAAKNLVVNGWAFISDKESSETAIYLEVTSADGKKHVYTTVKGSRPDVAKAYESELYAESGFEAVIPLDAIAEGENTITVIADNGQMLKASKSYTFNYVVGDDK